MVVIEGTLFHAEWCGHCKSFLPVWKKVKENIQKLGNQINGVKIKLTDYEESELKKISGNISRINNNEIKGYPTVKISIIDGKKKREYEYEGGRDEQDVMKHLTDIVNNK